jgi:Skp family chaperone for outer membrane proteins
MKMFKMLFVLLALFAIGTTVVHAQNEEAIIKPLDPGEGW